MARWLNNLNEQALVLHDQIAAVRAAEVSQDINLSSLVKLYQEKLAQLYAEQFPLASLMDSSDLIVRAKGPSTKEYAAVSSTVAWLCSEVDRRVRQLGMAALGLTGEPAVAAGHDLHVLLNGLAPGSLYLGFSLGSGHAAEQPAQTDFDDGVESAALSTVRDAVRELPLVPTFIGSEDVDHEIVDAFDDPVVRDAMLMAIYHLAPTGKRGIHTLEISSPGTSDRSSFLTNRERVVLREKAVRNPIMKKTREGTFVGVCREVDLDARRFQLRHVPGGVSSLRCVISQLTAETARKYIGKGVRVRGHFEAGPDDKPRLLEVESIEPYQIQADFLEAD